MTHSDNIAAMAKAKAALDLDSEGHSTPEHYAEVMFAAIEDSIDKLIGACMLSRGYVLHGAVTNGKERLAEALEEALKEWR